MLFWLGAGADGGADGAGAIVLAVVLVVVVLGFVVVEGLVDLFPPQPAVIAPSATTITAPAGRYWARCCAVSASQHAPFEGEVATPDPGPCSRPAHA
jgi:hypothetical protein